PRARCERGTRKEGAGGSGGAGAARCATGDAGASEGHAEERDAAATRDHRKGTGRNACRGTAAIGRAGARGDGHAHRYRNHRNQTPSERGGPIRADGSRSGAVAASGLTSGWRDVGERAEEPAERGEEPVHAASLGGESLLKPRIER